MAKFSVADWLTVSPMIVVPLLVLTLTGGCAEDPDYAKQTMIQNMVKESKLVRVCRDGTWIGRTKDGALVAVNPGTLSNQSAIIDYSTTLDEVCV